VGLGGSYRSRRRNCLLCDILLLHDCMGWDMVSALVIDAIFGVSAGSRQPRQKN
jgi:hypothetical protein